jgi:CopG antitoxin of type II toxin-antitoxin system
MSKTSDYKGPEYPTQPDGPIPAFRSYEEEAEWWDKTDTGAPEFEDVFTPVEVRSTCNYTKQLMFRVDEETDKNLERLAEERGMKKATLVRKIVRDWIRDQERHAS